MEKIKIHTEYIKLDQFLKWAGVTGSGSESKSLIADGNIKVNGAIETKRGKKLRTGDRIEVDGRIFEIE